MRVFQGPDGLSRREFRAPAVTIGVFDGLHRGHRHVITHLRTFADRLGGDAVVLTFEAHPMALLTGAPPRRILSTAHRLLLLGRLGVDATVVLPFDDRVRRMDYETFTRRVLVGGLGMRGLLFGYNGNFGHGGEGTPERLRALAPALDFEVEEAPAIQLGGRPISSTRIREAILAGRLAEAAEMLGRPVAVYGTVVPGAGRGRTLGFPTANVDLEGEIAPPAGVYQVVAALGAERFVAVANLGTRPTFDAPGAAPGPVVLEVHVPGLARDLAGQHMEVEFVRFLRPERRFASREELVAQIRSDLASLGARPGAGAAGAPPAGA